MAIVLGDNRYGKAESHVVRVGRATARHTLRDLTVSTSLRGDFARAHTDGDQSDVLPTDTQKNTAFAYAHEVGVASPEEYAVALGTRLLLATPAATSAQVRVQEDAWDRVPVAGSPDGHDHAFVRRGTEVRTCVVTVQGRDDARRTWVVSGLDGLTLLKTTGSEFRGFLRDAYTTLEETEDRVLATSLSARWRWSSTEGVDLDAAWAGVRAACLEAFATTYSRALQETLHAMGRAVLETHPQVAEIRFSAPNRHHVLVDLAPFGLANDGEVFHAVDRPYGLIEAAVLRDDAPPAGEAWTDVRSWL